MLELNTSTKFKKDYTLCQKRGLNLTLLQDAVNTLRIPSLLPPKSKDHNLSGNYSGCRECHIQPDWLLIYRISSDELYLVRTVSFIAFSNSSSLWISYSPARICFIFTAVIFSAFDSSTLFKINTSFPSL